MTRRGNAMAHAERNLTVGGGIAGLGLATALRRQGLTVEIVERSATWRSVGGIVLIPSPSRWRAGETPCYPYAGRERRCPAGGIGGDG
jgi:cation diffusion facilitator CzcD-associated flavoprotein CzcO